MFITDGYNIRIPRGDTACVNFTLTEADGGAPHILSSGQYVRLDVFIRKSVAPVITKTVSAAEQLPDGSVTFAFSPEDTDIAANEYSYSLKIVNGDGSRCDTWLGFPEDACFAVGTDCPPYIGYEPQAGIMVEVGQGAETLPRYDGEYSVTPSLSQDIVLETAQKTMSANVVVGRVPMTETQNAAGGITLTIGG
ncbi:MAG: hypothetical protein IK093_03445 [Ruminiclostridium sp.]|nr:hypothetical protein [Ruminiclostridium sp.]